MFALRSTVLVLTLALVWLLPSQLHAAAFLFDATKAESAGNANWVVDEDNAVAARYPTPDASGITASTPETYWTGALSSWGVALVQLGHTVEQLPVGARLTYGDSTNPQDLSHYQVYVVCEPNILFTAAERSALVRFVQDGGSLFVVSDHVGSDRNNDGYDSVAIWNDFFNNNGVQANPFGVTINSTNISVVSTEADPATDDPLTNGLLGAVTTLKYSNGATITLDPTANPTVRAAFWSTGTHTNSNVMAAYGSFGAGRFAVLCDSSPIDDGTGTPGHTLYYGWTEEGVNHSRLVLNASLWLASARNGGTPYNDSFARAIRLDPTATSATGTNVGASREPGEPLHAGNAGGASVWWQFTPANSGTMTISTQGTYFNTLLAVYTGDAVNTLTPVTANALGYASPVSFPVTAGITYHFAVDGKDGATGNIRLVLTQPAPPNDNFANATSVSYTGTAVTLAGNNFNATAEGGEPSHAGYAGGSSVWWRWTAGTTGYVTVSTLGSDFDTLLAVYTGSQVYSLTSVASNANYGSLLQSQLIFYAQAGTTYSIAVDGYAGAAGHIALGFSPANPNVPVNDNFANATAVSGASVQVSATNTYATAEPGEGLHGTTTPTHSVWWRWTAPNDGFITATTTGSAVSTVLAAYTGGNVANLTNLSGTYQPVVIPVQADTTYFFVVDSSTASTGKVCLNLTFTVTPAVPPNDNFADAITLTGTSPTASGVNVNGTLEAGEPAPVNATGGHTLWWRWTPTSDVVVAVNTYNSSFTPTIDVFTGGTLATLQRTTVVNFASGDYVGFGMRANTTYFIRADANSSGRTGLVSLSFTTAAMPTATIAATTPIAAEKLSSTPGVFTVTLDHAVPLGTMVYFTVGGTATLGPDYYLSYTGAYPGLYSAYVQSYAYKATVRVYPFLDDDPTEGDETVILTLAEGQAYKLGTASAATVTIRDASPYSSAWEQTYRALGFAGAQADPAADPDGDGIPNLLEWTFNLNPLAADGSGTLPTVGSAVFADPADSAGASRRFLTLTFTRRTDAPNLTYTVESTDNLAGAQWSSGGAVFVSASAVGMPANTERCVYRSTLPMEGPNAVAQRLLRVRVSAGTP